MTHNSECGQLPKEYAMRTPGAPIPPLPHQANFPLAGTQLKETYVIPKGSELEAHIYGQVKEGRYRYTHDQLLKALNYPMVEPLLPRCQLLSLPDWTKCLANDPDTQFAFKIHVNDGIDTSASSLFYPTVDDLSSLIIRNGRVAFMVKTDIKEAYRNIPTHPDDYGLLEVQWHETVSVDKFLPFSLHSAPKILSAVANAAQWLLTENGVRQILHYLVDFALIEWNQTTAIEYKCTLCSIFDSLGLPLEPSKLEGATTCLTFLRIEVDTINLQLHLPTDKLDRLLNVVEEVRGRKVISKWELQCLTGLLQHACKVVRPGRASLQRLYALANVGSAPQIITFV
uniref:Reverse transcriptase domain-containing protein n=1 Tax=Amphimedon queenslandica TaxID=400682 RepID=A0A1X7V581_AMPQE